MFQRQQGQVQQPIPPSSSIPMDSENSCLDLTGVPNRLLQADSNDPSKICLAKRMISKHIYLSKEVWKSNFRQYGEMKKQSAGRRVRRETIRRKKMQVREKVGKSRNTVFSWFCGSGGLKSRLAKAAGAETSGEMRDEKMHAVVARSTFGS